MTPCWNWGILRKSDGRAICSHTYAYILVWEAANSRSVPDGLSLHHLCENVACVRPDHLEPTTQAEHARQHQVDRNRAKGKARTHCPNGHPYTPENTRIVNSPRDGEYRLCRTCTAATKKRYRERNL